MSKRAANFAVYLRAENAGKSLQYLSAFGIEPTLIEQELGAMKKI